MTATPCVMPTYELACEAPRATKRALQGAYNQFHSARAAGDEVTMGALRQFVPSLLEEFDGTESDAYPCPGWERFVMRAGWAMANGDLRAALDFEMKAWHALIESEGLPAEFQRRRLGDTAANLSEQYRGLGNIPEALEWAEVAIGFVPDDLTLRIPHAIALYRTGRTTEADTIVSVLHHEADFDDPSDPLAACLKYERELLDLDLPSARALAREIARRQ